MFYFFRLLVSIVLFLYGILGLFFIESAIINSIGIFNIIIFITTFFVKPAWNIEEYKIIHNTSANISIIILKIHKSIVLLQFTGIVSYILFLFVI